MNNKLWQIAIGAAAVIAVGSIAAVGAAAVRPDSGMRVAYQPEGEAEESADTKTLPITTETTEPKTLPDIPAEIPVAVESVAELSYDEDLMISAIESFSHWIQLDYAPEQEDRTEYESGQIKLTITHCSEQAMQGAPDCLTARIVVMQDGQAIPFAVSEDGETALWQDTTAQVGFEDGRAAITDTEIWLTPMTAYRCTTISVLITYEPELLIDTDHNYFYHMQLVVKNPNPEDAPGCLLASDLDFVDYPDGTAHKVIIEGSDYPPTDIAVTKGDQGFGVDIGSPINYAEIPWLDNGDGTGCYHLKEEKRPDAYSRDVLYLRANADLISEAQVRGYGSTNLFAVVLCDGKPVGALNGENAVWFDKTDGSKTLNYKLTLGDSISDGPHLFSAVLIGENHDSAEYFCPTYGGRSCAVLNIVS